MNREQAKKLLPIIQAFAEGKTIQVKGPDNRWYDYKNKTCKLNFNSDPKAIALSQNPSIAHSKMQKSVGRKCRSINRSGG